MSDNLADASSSPSTVAGVQSSSSSSSVVGSTSSSATTDELLSAGKKKKPAVVARMVWTPQAIATLVEHIYKKKRHERPWNFLTDIMNLKFSFFAELKEAHDGDVFKNLKTVDLFDKIKVVHALVQNMADINVFSYQNQVNA